MVGYYKTRSHNILVTQKKWVCPKILNVKLSYTTKEEFGHNCSWDNFGAYEKKN